MRGQAGTSECTAVQCNCVHSPWVNRHLNKCVCAHVTTESKVYTDLIGVQNRSIAVSTMQFVLFHVFGFFCQAQPQFQISWVSFIFNSSSRPPARASRLVLKKQEISSTSFVTMIGLVMYGVKQFSNRRQPHFFYGMEDVLNCQPNGGQP